MKVSNCCGEKGDIQFDEGFSFYEAGYCPKCGEHCEYEETDLNTINTDDKPKEPDTTCTVPSAK